ncbi:MAG: oxidoreductase [Flavipsychrobacter sp.]|nr:oxidoreductase [Flavipsychrobacter sp.]
MIPAWQQGTVIRIEQATHNTRRYFISLPEIDSFHFKPGQFVTLDLPIHEQKNKRWRSYSIASAPDGTNVIELLISYVPEGAGTNYIFNNVHVGDTLTLRGPQGVFTLPETIDTDIVMICTGTGIAPFRSMLHYIHQQQLPHKELHLIFGTRTQSDLLYRDELSQLQASFTGFSFHPTLSREDWEGRQGYVHHVYEDLYKDKRPAYFFLCGWRMMIDEARQRILDMGYDKKQIHLELYG